MKVVLNAPKQTQVNDIITFTEHETFFVCLVSSHEESFLLVDLETGCVIVKKDTLEDIMTFANSNFTDVKIIGGNKVTLHIDL